MAETYTFYETGSIPGIPGLFAGVRVDVNDGGIIVKVTPLERHLAYAPDETSEVAHQALEAQDVPAEQTPLPLTEEQGTPEQPASPETVYHTEPSSPAPTEAASSSQGE